MENNQLLIDDIYLNMEEKVVKISPEEFKDLLKYVNGNVEAIRKFPDYRGKEIIIDGSLDLSGVKDIKNLNVIDYINGNLNMDYSSVNFFDKGKVKGSFRYYNSTMWNIEQKQIAKKKYDQLDELRKEGEWDVSKHDNETANETEALYNFLTDEGLTTSTDEDGKEIVYDKYYIWKTNHTHYNGYMYEWMGDDGYGNDYVVYSDEELEDSIDEAIRGSIDDMGYDAFPSYVWERFLDDDEVRGWLYDFHSDGVYSQPEDFGVPKELSDEQEKYVEIYETKIQKLNNMIKSGTTINGVKLTDDDIKEIRSEITDLNDLIEDIRENPEGDYSEDGIEKAIEAYVDDQVDTFPSFLDDMGFEKKYILGFVNIDHVVDYVKDDASAGSWLGSYDGTTSEYYVNNKSYHVMRYN
jgi:hypothetical protein